MQKMCYGLIVLWMLLCPINSSAAQVSIGINLPLFPEFIPVPGYPVYYAPQVDANYFFFDGMFWVFQDDNWYASSWYNGPWGVVSPEALPLFILRIPVYYYRQPPRYFSRWRLSNPPRWGERWGHKWEKRRKGWNRWHRGSVPSRAPLPAYQRQYSGDRYPRAEHQQTLRRQHYRYQPRDTIGREHFRNHDTRHLPPRMRPGLDRSRSRSQRRGDDRLQRSNPVRTDSQRRGSVSTGQRQQPSKSQALEHRSQDRKHELKGRKHRSQDKGELKRPSKDRGHRNYERRGGERNN